MRLNICTIGFAGKTAEEFFALLERAGVQQVVDIRENRVGQLSGYAKYPDLEYFLKRVAGIGYRHEPLLAPSPPIRDAYRETRDWPAYEVSFLALMRDRNVPQEFDAADFPATFALLCSEPGPEKCHRRIVAELLAEHWRSQGHDVEIEHLVAGPRTKSSPRKKRASTHGIDS